MKPAPDALRLAGMGAILFATLVRAMTGECGTPYWDLDPLLTNLPETTLLPSMGLALDALVWLGAAAAILGEAMAGRRVMWKSGVLVGIGAVGVFIHGLVLAPIGAPGLHGDFPSLIRGSAWAAAMVGAWGFAHLARDAEIRRVLGVSLLGFVILLAGVGTYEYFIEHAITVHEFDADPAKALAAQGMQPGTTAAMVFERRLRQPEALAWFGLANVYGSFAAAGFVGWLAITLASWRARQGRVTALCAGVCAVAAGALVISGSKGAAGAALLGVAIVAIGNVGRLRGLLSRWGSAIALGIVALPWAAVAARGVVGERLGELSLLFRAHYAIAALRIIAEHPLFGVGPAGFKIAYATAKVPTNPESVDSPHSLLLDWGATLGIFALAWIAVWLWWVARAGRGLAESTDARPEAQPGRYARPVAMLAILLSILFAWRLDMPTTLPGEMGLRAIAALLWIGVLFAPLPVTRLALGAAAIAMATHMQIEMTGVRTTSVLPAMLLIGLAGAPGGAVQPAGERAGRAAGVVCAALALVAGLAIIGTGAIPAARWDSHLRRAAEVIHAHKPPAPPEALAASERELIEADAILPSIKDPLLQAARLPMVIAQGANLHADSDGAARDSAEAIAIGERSSARFSNDSTVWSRLAILHTARFALVGDRTDLEAAAEAWERASALDPLALAPAVQCWRLNTELGRTDAAATWGRRALEIDDLLHLDPVVRLSPAARGSIERSLSKTPQAAPPIATPPTPSASNTP